MSFKPFFIHINRSAHWNGPWHPRKDPRGHTLYITPVDGDESKCVLRIATCSKNDQFCRATGRTVAQASEPHVLLKRDILYFLKQQDVWGGPQDINILKGFL